MSSYYSNNKRHLLDVVPEVSGPVLDFGGGAGNAAGLFREEGRSNKAVLLDQCVGEVDPHPSVDVAIKADLNDTSMFEAHLLDHGPFDVIFCLDILEHLIEPWDVVRTLDDHLAPGGFLVVSLPNVSHISVVARLALFDRWDLKDSGIMDRTHLRFFTKSGAMSLVQSGSAKISTVQPVRPSNVTPPLLRWLGSVGLGRFINYQYLILAQKA